MSGNTYVDGVKIKNIKDRKKKDGTFPEAEVRNMIFNTLTQGEQVSYTVLRERIRERYSIGTGRAKLVVDQSIALGLTICSDGKYRLTEGSLMGENNEPPF